MTGLEAFHGRWTGEEEVFATAWTPAGRARADLMLSSGPGDALIVDYSETRTDGSMTGHGIVLGDGWWWFDSYGFAPTAPGKAAWIDGELVLERSSERGRNVMVLASDGERLTMRLSAASGDGELQPLVAGVYRRSEQE